MRAQGLSDSKTRVLSIYVLLFPQKPRRKLKSEDLMISSLLKIFPWLPISLRLSPGTPA